MSLNLILGASGQDGRLLSKGLIEGGHRVIGVSRSRLRNLDTFQFAEPAFSWIQADLAEEGVLESVLEAVKPNAIYNLAGFSHVGDSWANEEISFRINFSLVKQLVEVVERIGDLGGAVPFLFHASSSEIFGDTSDHPQDERTLFSPVSPYGKHKARAHEFLRESRTNKGLKIGIGISYNHESPLRPENFVSRKISLGVNRIARGEQESLTLGNLDAVRDWGYAGDFVRAMTSIVAKQAAEDFIISTGVQHSIRDFLEIAFCELGVEDWQSKVVVDQGLIRPSDPKNLVGNPRKIERHLGWQPKTSFEALVRMMVKHDALG